MVMDDITSSFQENDSTLTSCIVIANFAHIPTNLPANTPLCLLYTNNLMQCTPLAQCLSINNFTPKIMDTSHVDKICVAHLPDKWVPKYRSRLRSYADIFEKGFVRGTLHQLISSS